MQTTHAENVPLAPHLLSATQTARATVDLDAPCLYLNSELSWPQFNWRVLEEALDKRHPLLERVKFLAIFARNLDEFFMIRVSGLLRQVTGGVLQIPPDGLPPLAQLAAIRHTVMAHLDRHAECWHHDVWPQLRAAGIQIFHYRELRPKQQAFVEQYCRREIFPVLTPLAFDPAHPFPHISNLSVNLAVVINDPLRGECFARVKVEDVFPRLVRIPEEDHVEQCAETGLTEVSGNNFVWLEEAVATHLGMLFPGLQVVAAYPFRVTRDADLEIQDDAASDLLPAIEEQVGMRHFGSVVRLEVDRTMPERMRDVLLRNLHLEPYQVYMEDGPLGLADIMELTRVDRPDLQDRPFIPAVPRPLAATESLFAAIRREDILLYHPYDSFMPVVDFVREAAHDPQVLAIKQTLYRVGANSPIVNALIEARAHGKQVAVLIELKARFDEENNIAWARALEEAGVHVVYGVVGLKTHAKMCLVVRREEQGMRRHILRRIEREIARHRQHGDGYLAFKMNALVDKPCIQALYRASQAGVQIDLQVRGICCLRPGIPGVSETITVTSIVGRFLEHARIYYCRNGGEEEVFLGSADLMPRNLDRRVELLFPVEVPRWRSS